MPDKLLFFIRNGAKSRADWYGQPPAETVACNGESCTVELPKARECGSFKVECRDCSAWALVSVAASVDDPKTFTMPCGRLKMSAEKESETALVANKTEREP
jgi:hypothetical protein